MPIIKCLPLSANMNDHCLFANYTCSSTPFLSHFTGKNYCHLSIDLILLPESIQSREVPCFFKHSIKSPDTSLNPELLPGVGSPVVVTQANSFHYRHALGELWATLTNTKNYFESFDPKMIKFPGETEEITSGNNNYCSLDMCLEKAMATHFSTFAWKIPWTEEPGRLQSMGSRRIRHN